MTETPTPAESDPLKHQKVRARRFILGFAVLWGILISVVMLLVPPEQRPGSVIPLIIVGCVIGAMGYYSAIKKEVVRKREQSLQRLLEQRRRQRQSPGSQPGNESVSPPVVMPDEPGPPNE
jgi:hypothetical protein